ncbi:helix-turn-helix domain-containing protein [Paenibacillus sp. UMB7766-LJ446]|uniref:helix-turn-helix domain-containing protein n=1 Tax=Paenibacillus sp. UMB7766-LJ446 TaxID=3046313 RepID=UPI0023D8CCFA|nr:helix-turn-helix domain-containing protein [Paenibacillus sp. UMB7766-LJ446]MDK8188680.1 helix-turn-helix domain-containing protein [Paenibacillus sp. UMB7766-LJ446]
MAKNMKKYMNVEALPEVMTVNDMKVFLGIGRVQAYDQIKRHEFHSVKIGRSIRFSKKNFLSWFEGWEAS